MSSCTSTPPAAQALGVAAHLAPLRASLRRLHAANLVLDLEHVAEHRAVLYKQLARRTDGIASGQLSSDGEAFVPWGSETRSEPESVWESAPEVGGEQEGSGTATVRAERLHRCSSEQGHNDGVVGGLGGGYGGAARAGQLGREDPGCGNAIRRQQVRRRQQEYVEREKLRRHQLPELRCVEVLSLASSCGGGASGERCLFGGCGCCCGEGGGAGSDIGPGGRGPRAPRLADVAPNVSYLVVAAHDPTTCRCGGCRTSLGGGEWEA